VGAKHPLPNPNAESIFVNPTACNFLSLGMPIAAGAALLGININDAGPPTRVIQLLNMMSRDDLQNDDDFGDIVDEIKEECAKYGQIISMFIPRPPPRDYNSYNEEGTRPKRVWGLGKIFIEYKRKEDAHQAQQSLGGRKFNCRLVVSGFYSEDRYLRKDFIPDEVEEKAVADKFRAMQQAKEQEMLEEGFYNQFQRASSPDPED